MKSIALKISTNRIYALFHLQLDYFIELLYIYATNNYMIKLCTIILYFIERFYYHIKNEEKKNSQVPVSTRNKSCIEN